MSHAKTLTDIVHVRQVSTTAQKGADTDVTSLLTAAQQAKVSVIDGLLIEVGNPTIDEELDATITALTDIVDDGSDSGSVSSSAVESLNSFKMSYNSFERGSMLLSQNYYQRLGGGYVQLDTDAMAVQDIPLVYGGQVIAVPSNPGAGIVLTRSGRFLWQLSPAQIYLPTPTAALSVEVYDPSERYLMSDSAKFSVDDMDDAASWWPQSTDPDVYLQYHGVAVPMSGVINVFNPGDAPASVASLLTSVEVGDVLPIWFRTGTTGGLPGSSASDMASVILQATFTQLNSEPSRGEPSQAALEADAAMRSVKPSGLALAKAADAEGGPT